MVRYFGLGPIAVAWAAVASLVAAFAEPGSNFDLVAAIQTVEQIDPDRHPALASSTQIAQLRHPSAFAASVAVASLAAASRAAVACFDQVSSNQIDRPDRLAELVGSSLTDRLHRLESSQFLHSQHLPPDFQLVAATRTARLEPDSTAGSQSQLTLLRKEADRMRIWKLYSKA